MTHRETSRLGGASVPVSLMCAAKERAASGVRSDVAQVPSRSAGDLRLFPGGAVDAGGEMEWRVGGRLSPGPGERFVAGMAAISLEM